VVKRVIHRCRNKFNVSAAEVEDQDFSDRAVIGVVAVGNDRRYLEGLLEKLETHVVRMALADVLEAPKMFEVF